MEKGRKGGGMRDEAAPGQRSHLEPKHFFTFPDYRPENPFLMYVQSDTLRLSDGLLSSLKIRISILRVRSVPFLVSRTLRWRRHLACGHSRVGCATSVRRPAKARLVKAALKRPHSRDSVGQTDLEC